MGYSLSVNIVGWGVEGISDNMGWWGLHLHVHAITDYLCLIHLFASVTVDRDSLFHFWFVNYLLTVKWPPVFSFLLTFVVEIQAKSRLLEALLNVINCAFSIDNWLLIPGMPLSSDFEAHQFYQSPLTTVCLCVFMSVGVRDILIRCKVRT